MSSTTGESSWAKVAVGSAAASSYVPVDSDASWDQVSDHRDCHHTREPDETEWHMASRPASPPLDVPPAQPNIWLKVAQVTDDRKVAIQLYEELERRPFKLPSRPADSTVMSFVSEDTLSPFNKDMTPVRYAKTPPPAPDGELEHALKAFQESEGARLYGFEQCNAEARAALVAFLVHEGNDNETAILIADELDGVEKENGLARNEHGCWFRISEGEAGRKRKWDFDARPPQCDGSSTEYHASSAQYYAAATRGYAPSTTPSLSMQRMREQPALFKLKNSLQPATRQRQFEITKSEPIRSWPPAGKGESAPSRPAAETFGEAMMRKWAKEDKATLMRPPDHPSPVSSTDGIEWEEILPLAFPPEKKGKPSPPEKWEDMLEEECKPVIVEEMKPRAVRLSEKRPAIPIHEHPLRQMLREREEKVKDEDDYW